MHRPNRPSEKNANLVIHRKVEDIASISVSTCVTQHSVSYRDHVLDSQFCGGDAASIHTVTHLPEAEESYCLSNHMLVQAYLSL
jgi:hypothetical protein